MAKKNKIGATYKFVVVALMLASAFVGVDLVQRKQSLSSQAAGYTSSTSLSARPVKNMPGGSESVTWFSLNPLPQGWIGLYSVNSLDTTALLKKNLTECSQVNTAWGSGSRAGTCLFNMPSTTGVYEFRLFKGSLRVATSNQVLVSTSTPTPTPHISVYPTAFPSLTPYPSVTCYPPPPCLYTDPKCLMTDMPTWCPEF